MSSTKPVRIIDAARKLQLSTSTIISFLQDKCFPVKRKHHSPLIKEIINDLSSEFFSGRSISAIDNLCKDAILWEKEHPEDVERIKNIQSNGLERKRKRTEHIRRIVDGRRRAREARKKEQERERALVSIIQSVESPTIAFNGRISVNGLDLEIIAIGLALPLRKKQEFISYLASLSSFLYTNNNNYISNQA